MSSGSWLQRCPRPSNRLVLGAVAALLLVLFVWRLTRIPFVQLNGDEHLGLIESIAALRLYSGEAVGAPLVLDVGANQGGVSMIAALRSFQVVAFEAIEHNVSRVRAAARRYGVESSVRVVHGAVWDRSGDTKYFLPQPSADFDGQMIKQQRGGSGDAPAVPVQTVTIDEEAVPVDRDVVLLKIDVEGCEYRALLGARRLLETRRVPFILVEYSPLNLKTVSDLAEPEQMLTFLSDQGYELFLYSCHWTRATSVPWSCHPDRYTPQLVQQATSAGGTYTGAFRGAPLAQAKHIRRSDFAEFTNWMVRQGGPFRSLADILAVRARDIPIPPE